jgi:hypothetical protein
MSVRGACPKLLRMSKAVADHAGVEAWLAT